VRANSQVRICGPDATFGRIACWAVGRRPGAIEARRRIFPRQGAALPRTAARRDQAVTPAGLRAYRRATACIFRRRWRTRMTRRASASRWGRNRHSPAHRRFRQCPVPGSQPHSRAQCSASGWAANSISATSSSDGTGSGACIGFRDCNGLREAPRVISAESKRRICPLSDLRPSHPF
jgi:hypothetical protein